MKANLLEKLIREAGDYLSHIQVAKVWKIPEEMRQTPCDFFGFSSSGRAILIEAKQVNRTSLPVGKTPGLAPHQYNALKAANKAGAIALLAWANGDQVAVISFDMVLSLSKERKSIPWNSVDKYYKDKFNKDTNLWGALAHWIPS